ncbi:MAG: type III pantothenate kinase [Salibacteraceae bacterium]
MHLLLDLGNTNAKLAVLTDSGEKLRLERVPAAALQQVVEHLRKSYSELKRVAISSVAKPDAALDAYLQGAFELVLWLDHTTPIPVTKHYKTPATLGNDRVAAVVGAAHQFPKTNVLVIDAGTCITYDLVTASGDYLGGSISPGIQMRYKSLHTFTARLPLLGLQEGVELIGTSTNTAMRSGVQQGILAEVRGIISAYQGQFPDLKVVITGGDSEFFVKALKNSIFADPNLVLNGLNVILNHYVSYLSR